MTTGYRFMKIRPYIDSDKENVRFVCLNSEGPCTMTDEEQRFILTTYCDYYLETEPENCFVAADDANTAIGYVICTQSFNRFYSTFINDYIPRLSDLPERYALSALRSVDLQQKYKAEFPAHLHIDILPPYQRKGLGHLLIDALCTHLQNRSVPGVMLTVGSLNYVGQSFYNKYGFVRLEEYNGDIAYGLHLQKQSGL